MGAPPSYRQFDARGPLADPSRPASDRPSRPDEGDTHPAWAVAGERLDHASDAVSLSHDLRSATEGRPEERADLANRAARRFISGGFSPFGASSAHPENERVIALASLCNRWRETGGPEAGHASQMIAQMVFDGDVPLAAAEPDDIARLAHAFGHFAGPGAAAIYKNAIARVADHVADLPNDQLTTFEPQHLARLGGAFEKVEGGEGEEVRNRRVACDRATTGIAKHVRDLPDHVFARFNDEDRAQLRRAFDKVERGETVTARRRRTLCDAAAERIARPARPEGRAPGAASRAEVAPFDTNPSRRDPESRAPRTGGGGRSQFHGRPVLPPVFSRDEPLRSKERDRGPGCRETEWRAPRFGREDRSEPQRRPGRAQQPVLQFAPPSHGPSRPDEGDVDPAFAAAVAILDNARDARELSFSL